MNANEIKDCIYKNYYKPIVFSKGKVILHCNARKKKDYCCSLTN